MHKSKGIGPESALTSVALDQTQEAVCAQKREGKRLLTFAESICMISGAPSGVAASVAISLKKGTQQTFNKTGDA